MNIHNFLLSTTMLLILCGTTVADVKDRMVERRAIEAAVWGMPIVNFQAMRDGLKKDAGVGFNDVAYNSKVQTWRLRTTTNNNTTPYIFIFWNVKDGPVVIDIPPSSKASRNFRHLDGRLAASARRRGREGQRPGTWREVPDRAAGIPGAVSPWVTSLCSNRPSTATR